ncbi:MAG: hypothetical protein ACFFB0_17220 [Promethearchaeota archaeon]
MICFTQNIVRAEEQESEDDILENPIENSVYFNFGADLPAYKYVSHFAAYPERLTIGLRDCCIRDDVVEVSVDGNYIGTVDSRGGPDGTHEWEYLTIDLSQGDHTIEFKNTISGVGPSGWYYDLSYNYFPIAESNGPFTLIDPATGEPYPFGFYIAFEGNTVVFDGSGSYDPDGTIVWYAWYFLGTEPPWNVEFSLEGSTPYISYSWDDPYASLISLWVWDDGGLTDDDLAYVLIFDVPIDIKPGSYPNSINPRGKGIIPVAILNENYFDPEWVNPETVTFGPSGTEASPVHWAYEDVDNDGDIDIIFHFRTQEAGFIKGDTMGFLIANFWDGNTIHAEDSVRTVPP